MSNPRCTRTLCDMGSSELAVRLLTAPKNLPMSQRSCIILGFLWIVSVAAFHSSRLTASRTAIQGTFPVQRPAAPLPPAWPCERCIRTAPSGSLAAQAPESNEEAGDGMETVTTTTSVVAVPHVDEPRGIKRALRRVARFFGAGKGMPSMKELGLYAILSYGFVSNISYAIGTAIAWYISSRKSGFSPLAPGQWQFFMVCWTGLWAVNNVLRIPRFGLSVAISPAFDRIIAFLMEKTGRGKTVATVLCVLLVNVLGTFAILFSGIFLASLFSGVPIWPAS